MKGRFIAIVGPSGVGKDSVMAAMTAQEPRLHLARRVITRPASAGGEDFEGVTEDNFHTRAAAGEFALSWAAHDLQYAIPATVATQLENGQDVLANLSRAMLPAARHAFSSCVFICLTASRDVLATRLAARGRETTAQITDRLNRSNTDLPPRITAHFIDNSGEISQTVQTALELLYPIKTARCN